MSTTTGTFTAPNPGTYFFAFSGLNLGSGEARVKLQKQTNTFAAAYVSAGSYETFALQATLLLRKGDEIRLNLTQGEIHESNQRYTNFVGFLLEEELV